MDELERLPNRGHSDRLSPGQIGCALSHVGAYKDMVSRGIERAVIIEDDVALPRNFDSIARATLSELREGEIISLYSPTMQRQEFSTHNSPVMNGCQLVTPMDPRTMRTALCYAIHIDAARRIGEFNDPVRVVADDFASFYREGLVQYLRAFSPGLVSVAAFKSKIGYIRRNSLKFYASEILNSLPGIRALLKVRRKRLRLAREGNHVLVEEPSPLHHGNPNYGR